MYSSSRFVLSFRTQPKHVGTAKAREITGHSFMYTGIFFFTCSPVGSDTHPEERDPVKKVMASSHSIPNFTALNIREIGRNCVGTWCSCVIKRACLKKQNSAIQSAETMHRGLRKHRNVRY